LGKVEFGTSRVPKIDLKALEWERRFDDVVMNDWHDYSEEM
jgi:hypothetical protein